MMYIVYKSTPKQCFGVVPKGINLMNNLWFPHRDKNPL